ncbi:hypothetical protein ACFWH7_04340 [Cellulosimicrobium cellulans]|uniref:hypothetical protein n=1 Tax=Cellulosimicrobium cellulans TaxID=1710 RepID=UPI0036583F4A
MTVERDLAGRVHSEFCDIVTLSREMDRLAEQDFMTIGRRWSHALDILSKTARVHNGARKLLAAGSTELAALDKHPFCMAWAHDFAHGLNTQCTYDAAVGGLATCGSCATGYLPCPQSLGNPTYVQRGMAACREMRNRYEHYDEYFTGTGYFQRARKDMPQAAKPDHEPWAVEGMSGGTRGDEIRLDVYEHGSQKAYTLNVRLTVEALRPVVRAVTLLPEVADQRHEDGCEYCR